MDAFAEEFLERYARHWKPRTLAQSACLVRKYILPAFGHPTVDAIAVEHVRDWFAAMAERPGSANRAMPALSVMMKMAELWGYRRHNSNPGKNTRRYRMPPTERFLTAEELARLNAVLTREEFWCPHIVAIVRLLMLTGCRLGEIVSLEWDWIRGKRIHLPDSKFGPRTVWLSSAARAVIDAIPRPDYVQSSGWDHRIPGIAGILARVDHGGPSAIRGLEARAPRRPRPREAARPS